VRKFCTIRTFPHCLQASAATARVIRSTHGDLYLTLELQKTHKIFILMCHAAGWLPKIAVYYKLLHFCDFVYFVFVVSCQFISFVTKMGGRLVARITSSRLVFTSLLGVWDGIDLMITVNTGLRSQWNAAYIYRVRQLKKPLLFFE